MDIVLGEIEITITGVNLPIRKASDESQEKISNKLARILEARIREGYKLEVAFEIVQITSGCIRTRYRVVLKKTAGGIVGAAVLYGGLRAGVDFLWSDFQALSKFISFTVDGYECRAFVSKNDLGQTIYGPVKEGESLSEVSANIINGCDEFSEFELQDLMDAIYVSNKSLFAGGNIDVLYKDSIIVVPSVEFIRGMKAKR